MRKIELLKSWSFVRGQSIFVKQNKGKPPERLSGHIVALQNKRTYKTDAKLLMKYKTDAKLY